MIVSKIDYLAMLRSRLSEEDMDAIQNDFSLVISIFNRETIHRIWYTQEEFEGDVDTERAESLGSALSAYLESYMADKPEGHKWIILCCLFLSMIAGEPMHPQPLTDWEETDGVYFCGAREDSEGSLCRWCVCRSLNEKG